MYNSSQGQEYYGQQSTQQGASSVFIDQPGPSWGMVAFFAITFLLLIVVFALIPFFSYHNGVMGAQFIVEIVIFVSLIIATISILGITFFACFNIKYIVNDQGIEMRAGRFPPFTLAFHEIGEVKKVPYTTRLLGFGLSSAGVCNRFRNVVLIRAKHRSIYLSPSNPDQFIEQLNAALRR